MFLSHVELCSVFRSPREVEFTDRIAAFPLYVMGRCQRLDGVDLETGK